MVTSLVSVCSVLLLLVTVLCAPFCIANAEERTARRRSIVGRAHERFVYAVGSLALSQLVMATAWFCWACEERCLALLIAVPALAARAILFAADVVDLLRLRRLASTIARWDRAFFEHPPAPRFDDIGLGQMLAVERRGELTYRAAPGVVRAVRGDPVLGYRTVRTLALRHALCFAIATGIPALTMLAMR